MPWRSARVGRWLAALSVALAIGLWPSGAGASVTFTSNLSVSERYSDNVFFSPTDPRSDLSTLVVPGVALAFEGKDATLTATYGLVAEYHYAESGGESLPNDANGVTQSIGLGLTVPLLTRQSRRVDVGVYESMTYTTELPAFSLGQDATEANQGIQIPRTTTFRNSAGASLTYGWSARVRTAISYENVITRYAGDDLQDETINSGDLETTYLYSQRTDMAFALGVTDQEYGGAGSVTAWDATVYGIHRLTTGVTVDGRVGGAVVRANVPEAPRSRFFVWEVEGTKTLEALNMRVSYQRAIGSGAGLIASATVNEQLTGGATWNVSRKVSANLDVAWARNEAVSDESFSIYTYAGTIGASVGLTEWLGGSASYSYLTQRAEGPAGPDGSRNLVMLTLTATGPSWRMAK
jgi:hypothetical protein